MVVAPVLLAGVPSIDSQNQKFYIRIVILTVKFTFGSAGLPKPMG